MQSLQSTAASIASPHHLQSLLFLSPSKRQSRAEEMQDTTHQSESSMMDWHANGSIYDSQTSNTNGNGLAAAAPIDGDNDNAQSAAGSGTRNIYLATYSAVAVYELMVRGIACMRRRTDGYINATQILKIASIDKARRTKILEKEILTGEHEKVQGGYGKYQGTWIPLRRAQELAATYNVAHLLAPLLEFDPANAASVPLAGPRKRTTAPTAAAKAKARSGKAASNESTPSIAGPSQQPRFISLRPPPGVDANGSLNGMTDSSSFNSPKNPVVEERNTSLVQGSALNGSEKRTADSAFDDDLNDRSIKRNRIEGVATLEGGQVLLGPSPVKDLNALGRSGSPTSALRGVRVPNRLHRVALGPPDEFRQLQVDGTRFADRPQISHDGSESERRMRSKLLQLFVEEKLAQADAEDQTEVITPQDQQKLDEYLREMREAAQSPVMESTAQFANGTAQPTGETPTDLALADLAIDTHGHTTLHWSAALAKVSYVRMLVSRPPNAGGANTHAGNHGGETALHRTVLVSNSYDSSAFPALLHLLSPSLHTRDYRKRTVLHHIALISALKGRGVAARYYLSCVLKYIQQHQGGRYGSLIDAQDDEGETALSIVARVGNVHMVKLLLEVGARKDIPNHLGLRASDWGIDGIDNIEEEITSTTTKDKASEPVTALMRPPRAPVQKSKDVLDQVSNVLQDLTEVFEKELTDKEEAFNAAQTQLQNATRDLALRRRRITDGQSLVAQKDEARMRRQNLNRALAEELQVEIATENDNDELVASVLTFIEAGTIQTTSDELTLPNNESEIFKQRWLNKWYETSIEELQKRIRDFEKSQQSKMEQCRKIVAMCCGIANEKVEEMLEELVTAIESIGSEGVDLQRLAGFLSKVKETKS